MKFLPKILLVLGDIIILYLSFYLALVVRHLSFDKEVFFLFKKHLSPFVLIFAIWILVFIIFDFYNLKKNKGIEFYKNALVASAISFSLSMGIFYVSPPAGLTPKTVLLIFVFIFTLLFYFWRYFYDKTVSSKLFLVNIMIFGNNLETKELLETIKIHPQLGYKISAHYKNIEDGVKNIQDEINLKNIKLIVIPDAIHQNADSLKSFYESLFLNIDFINFSNFYEIAMGRVPLSVIEEAWFLKNISAAPKNIYVFVKRMIDLILAGSIFIVSLLFYPLIIIAIKLDSNGSAFIIQKRIGQNNKIFKNIKFRTMLVNDDGKWPSENDERITRVGKFLRKTRIDELPQLINVLIGDISLVGPRPDIIDLYKKLENELPYYKIRNLIKPGLSGWAQVNQEVSPHSIEETKYRLSFDFYYLKNKSLILDAIIILKTIRTLLSTKGS